MSGGGGPRPRQRTERAPTRSEMIFTAPLVSHATTQGSVEQAEFGVATSTELARTPDAVSTAAKGEECDPNHSWHGRRIERRQMTTGCRSRGEAGAAGL